jgi:hypothetical protein
MSGKWPGYSHKHKKYTYHEKTKNGWKDTGKATKWQPKEYKEPSDPGCLSIIGLAFITILMLIYLL